MSYLPTVPDETYVFETEEGDSQTCADIVDFLRSHSLRRSVHNLLRRRRELATVHQQREVDEGWVFFQNADGDVYTVSREFISPN